MQVTEQNTNYKVEGRCVCRAKAGNKAEAFRYHEEEKCGACMTELGFRLLEGERALTGSHGKPVPNK